MPRFDFQSPGAAVTDALTRLVTQRKLEARQNLQDQLNVEANDRANKQAEEEHAWRQFQEGQMLQKNEADRVDSLTSTMAMGDDPEQLGYDPKDIDLLKRHGKLRQMPAISIPKVGMLEGTPGADASGKPKYGYVGSLKEQEEDKQRKATGGMLMQMLAGSDPVQRQHAEDLARRATANNGIATEQMFRDAGFGPQKRYISVDQDTNKATDLGTYDSNAEVHFEPRTPRTTWTWAGDIPPSDEYPNGATKMMGSDGTIKVVEGAHRLRPPAPPKPPAAGAQPKWAISPTVLNRINDAALGFAKSGDPAALETIKVAAKNAFINSPASPLAKNLAALYLDSPKAYADQLQRETLTPKDMEDLKQLLMLVPTGAKAALKKAQ